MGKIIILICAFFTGFASFASAQAGFIQEIKNLPIYDGQYIQVSYLVPDSIAAEISKVGTKRTCSVEHTVWVSFDITHPSAHAYVMLFEEHKLQESVFDVKLLWWKRVRFFASARNAAYAAHARWVLDQITTIMKSQQST